MVKSAKISGAKMRYAGMPVKFFFIVIIVLLCSLTGQSALALPTGSPMILRGLPGAVELLIGMLAFFVLSIPLLLLIRFWAQAVRKRSSSAAPDKKLKNNAQHSIYFCCATGKAEWLSTLTFLLIVSTAPFFVGFDTKLHSPLAFRGALATAALVSPVSLLLSLILGLRSWYLMFLYGSAKDFSFADRRFYYFGFFHYGLFLLIAYAAYRY
ncbi:MAG: hypothetical protein ACK4PK_05695 [Alphaproteobacteria bacterium]